MQAFRVTCDGMPRTQPRPPRTRMRAYRERLRRQGLRLVQVWVPDVRSPRFAAEARRQSLLVSREPSEREFLEVLGRNADFTGWKA